MASQDEVDFTARIIGTHDGEILVEQDGFRTVWEANAFAHGFTKGMEYAASYALQKNIKVPVVDVEVEGLENE